MKSGKIPDEWRDVNVTPIYKKGIQSDPGNYRGINLECGVEKTMEQMIKGDMDEHIESNDILSKTQRFQGKKIDSDKFD